MFPYTEEVVKQMIEKAAAYDGTVRDGGPNITAYSFFRSLYLHLFARIQA
ncbi:MAG: hypothetical protein MJ249_06930 [Kiritimatiellae bacterium]|nr:hypothetical protein [Kiritimatiellia bacterium]